MAGRADGWAVVVTFSLSLCLQSVFGWATLMDVVKSDRKQLQRMGARIDLQQQVTQVIVGASPIYGLSSSGTRGR